MTTDILPTRDALIEAGLTLLIEEGPKGLTLRRAAARAGVSHAAPAHHFKGLPGLQTAIATRAFAIFTEAMIRRRDRAEATPFGRLLGICEGYLDFATERAGLFHVMFNCPDLNPADPALQREREAAYSVLRAACLPFTGQADRLTEGLVWSSVHGYAMLGFQRSGGQAGQDAPPFRDFLARIVDPAFSAPR